LKIEQQEKVQAQSMCEYGLGNSKENTNSKKVKS